MLVGQKIQIMMVKLEVLAEEQEIMVLVVERLMVVQQHKEILAEERVMDLKVVKLTLLLDITLLVVVEQVQQQQIHLEIMFGVLAEMVLLMRLLETYCL